MAQIQLEYPFNLFPKPALHCPACGAQTLAPDGEGDEPCEHLLYVFLPEVDDFLHVAPDFEALFRRRLAERESAASEGEDELVCGSEVISALLDELGSRPSTIFGLSWTTSGMACGPVSSTVYVGFRLAGERLEPAGGEAPAAKGGGQ